MTRTYNQECVLAYALDLLGERWTLLIVRELLLGPRRFGDLQMALPGIGTNLLSKRLKELVDTGILFAGEFKSANAANRYRLTDQGEALRSPLRALMYWSIEYFLEQTEPSPPRDCLFSNNLQPDSVALAIEVFASRAKGPASQNYVLHLTIDDSAYTYYFMNQEMIARRGADAPAVASLETDVATLMQAMRGEIGVGDALKRSRASGDQTALAHFTNAIAPGADVAFEVSEQIKALKRARREIAAEISGLTPPAKAATD